MNNVSIGSALESSVIIEGMQTCVLPEGLAGFTGDIKSNLPNLCDRSERYYDFPVLVGQVYRWNSATGMGYIKVRPMEGTCALNFVFFNEQVGPQQTKRLKDGQTVLFQKDRKDVVVTLQVYTGK